MEITSVENVRKMRKILGKIYPVTEGDRTDRETEEEGDWRQAVEPCKGLARDKVAEVENGVCCLG